MADETRGDLDREGLEAATKALMRHRLMVDDVVARGAATVTVEAYLSASRSPRDLEAAVEAMARRHDPGAFTGEGYSPGAAEQSREDALATARAMLEAALPLLGLPAVADGWYMGAGEEARKERVRRGLEDEAGNILALTAEEAAREPGGSAVADGPEPEGLSEEECAALVRSLRWVDAKALDVDTPADTWTLAAIRDKTEARLASLRGGDRG